MEIPVKYGVILGVVVGALGTVITSVAVAAIAGFFKRAR